MLDRLPVERQRGITVKAQTATMFHKHHGTMYMLNLIDTPVSACFHGNKYGTWTDTKTQQSSHGNDGLPCTVFLAGPC